MPKKGIVKCQACDTEFEGTLPDNMRVGYNYVDLDGEISDFELLEKLKQHHYNTASIKLPNGGNLAGHKIYDVFLEDGHAGLVEANSYCVIYQELGKERRG
jgi:hypothetical protein